MRKICFYFVLLPVYLIAQQESYFGLYQYNLQMVNPAYTASDGKFSATLLNRSQWVSLENAPKTTAFAFSSERKNNVGLGLSIISDKVFVEKQTFAYIDFSYKLDLGDALNVYLGLKAGGNFYNSDSAALKSYSVEPDPAQRLLSKFNPNIGVGVFLQGTKYWVSLSIPRLFNVSRDQDFYTSAKDRRHAYIGAGTQLTINDRFILKPSVMLRKVKGLPMSADITNFLSIKNRMDFGLSYRTNASISYMIFVNLINGIDVGYAYETPTDQSLSGLRLKTHEILLRFRIGDNVVKTEEVSGLQN